MLHLILINKLLQKKLIIILLICYSKKNRDKRNFPRNFEFRTWNIFCVCDTREMMIFFPIQKLDQIDLKSRIVWGGGSVIEVCWSLWRKDKKEKSIHF